MAASWDTVKAIYTVMRRHVTDEQIQKILVDLYNIDGNKSFRDTIYRLVQHDMVDGSVNRREK